MSIKWNFDKKLASSKRDNNLSKEKLEQKQTDIYIWLNAVVIFCKLLSKVKLANTHSSQVKMLITQRTRDSSQIYGDDPSIKPTWNKKLFQATKYFNPGCGLVDA